MRARLQQRVDHFGLRGDIRRAVALLAFFAGSELALPCLAQDEPPVAKPLPDDEVPEVIVVEEVGERVMIDVLPRQVVPAVPMMRLRAAQVGDQGEAEERNAALENLYRLMRRLVKRELGVLYRVCDLTDAEKVAMEKGTEAKIAGTHDILIPLNDDNFDVGFVSGERIVANCDDGNSLNTNPYTRASVLVMSVAKEVLPPEKAQLYKDELAAQQRVHREAIVGTVVCQLDNRLFLSDEQSQKITEKLISRWSKADDVYAEAYFSNPQYLPNVPVALIEPELDSRQAAIWRTIHRVNFPLQITSMAEDEEGDGDE